MSPKLAKIGKTKAREMNTQPNQFINGPHPISPSVRGRTKRRVRSRRHYTRRDANMWQAFVALVQLLKLLDHLAWFLGRGMLAGTLWTILACWKLALRCLGVDVDRAARRKADKSARGLDPVSLATTEVPERIVLSSRGDPQKLRTKMRGWMKWRAEYHIETILHSPKPSFAYPGLSSVCVRAFARIGSKAASREPIFVFLFCAGASPLLL